MAEQAMVKTFDRIVIAVPALAQACEQYRRLLGVEPASPGDPALASAWFVLPNTVIELVHSVEKSPRIRGIVFAVADADKPVAAIAKSRGLELGLSTGRRTTALREAGTGAGDKAILVDHLVLRTADAAACIDLFGARLGIRLALDKTVPEWGGRMLFFRAGKVTLEVIEPERDRPESDYFWGIAYQCRDLDQTARLLAGRGVVISAIRPGRKPGSRVATVKSHCLDLPTLLLQPPG